MIILAKTSMCPIAFCTDPNPPMNIDLSLMSSAQMRNVPTIAVINSFILPKGTKLTQIHFGHMPSIKSWYMNVQQLLPFGYKFIVFHKWWCLNDRCMDFVSYSMVTCNVFSKQSCPSCYYMVSNSLFYSYKNIWTLSTLQAT